MDVLAAHAERQPDRAAIVDGARVLSWRAFVEMRDRLAHALAALPLAAEARVVLYAENSLEFLVAAAAVRAVGALPVPMNHRLAAPEVAHILHDSEAALVFADDRFLPVVEAVRPRAAVRHWILLGAARRPWALTLGELVRTGSRAPYPVDPAGLGRSMVYTAGTTGKPKGAFRRAADPAATLPVLAALGVADPAHVHLVAGPLYHSAPGGFAGFAHLFGNTVVVMRKFEPETALRLIEEHRCTTTFMAPILLKRIVDLPPDVQARYDLGSIRSIVIAAAPCPMRVKEQALRLFGPVVYEFYGSTELGINTVLTPEDMLRKPGSCGAPAPGIELAILDDQGGRLPPRTPGELHVRRHPGMFDGYHRQPEAAREIARGDWFSVGDVAWMDEEDFVYICDRKRDMIISGGVNIYPAEIEDVLHRHPKIQDVAVFGVPDEDWGERVHAAIQLRPGATLTGQEVVDFAREQLGGHKLPREVSFHTDFPRDAAGKLVKRALREPYWAGRETRV